MTVGEVRRLVDLLRVYRRHVKDFAKIAKPIYELLDGKNHKVKSPPINGQLPSKHPIKWTEEHGAAMNKLIECITSPPILAYPDYNAPFVVHTDASQHARARSGSVSKPTRNSKSNRIRLTYPDSCRAKLPPTRWKIGVSSVKVVNYRTVS